MSRRTESSVCIASCQFSQRARRRERVLNRGQLFHLLRHPRPIPIVQVIAEEVFVILVVPRIGFIELFQVAALLRRGRGLGRLEVFGGNLLEHRILDHFLVQEVRQLERRHRQQLDRLLQ
jgi:hypothetical protein